MAIALILMTEPGNPEANGRMIHLLKAAERLSEQGEDVGIYMHGAGVNWASAFAVRDDRFTQNYGELFDQLKSLIVGACNFCATVRFEQAGALDALGIDLVGNDGEHHTVADLLMDDTKVVTF